MRVYKSGEPPGAAAGKKTFLLNHRWKSWMWAGMSFCMFIKPATRSRLGAFWNLDFLNMSLWVSKLLRCQSHNFLQSQLLWNSTLTQPQTPWHQNFYQGTGIQLFQLCDIISQISHSRTASERGSFWFLCFVPDWLNEFVFIQWSKEQPWSSRLFSSFSSSPARAWVSHRVSTSTLDSHLDCMQKCKNCNLECTWAYQSLFLTVA